MLGIREVTSFSLDQYGSQEEGGAIENIITIFLLVDEAMWLASESGPIYNRLFSII